MIMVESSIVTYNGKIIDYSVGTPVSVEFNFDRIWEFKNRLDIFRPEFLSFFHVHPSGMLGYSITDLNCMQGFAISFGFVNNFSIITFNNPDLFCLCHEKRSFAYESNQVIQHDRVKELEENQLMFLKYLSYGQSHVCACHVNKEEEK